MDDSDHCNRLSKRLCIKSSHALLVFATILVTLNNVTYAIRVRELCSWTPTFIGYDSDSDEVSSIGMFEKYGDKLFKENDVESDIEIIGDTRTGADDHEQEVHKQENKADIPANTTFDVPNGFSPTNDEQQTSDSIHTGRKSLKQPGFSLLDRLDETIKVGLALGLNMEGCEKTLASHIANKGGIDVNQLIESKMSQVDPWMLRQVWGNIHFDFTSSSARGMSGATWDCIMVMRGDFNEVPEASERYGSVFNDCQAKFFNEFIDDTSLIDILLGGFNYTWIDK
ncbi:hypothetical protein Tco_0223705 [Tanacetum coccineum]